jgi:hypothetical protein
MEDVESRTLDALFEDFAIDVCDLLKVDCEGGEHSFLPSCAPVTLQRIRRIALEYHDLVDGQTERGLKPFLERHGFIVDALRRDMSKKENVGMLYGIRAQ